MSTQPESNISAPSAMEKLIAVAAGGIGDSCGPLKRIPCGDSHFDTNCIYGFDHARTCRIIAEAITAGSKLISEERDKAVAALDTAIDLCQVSERRQDDEWHQQLDEITAVAESLTHSEP